MAIRLATARWNGTLKEGDGTFTLQSGAAEAAFTWGTRFGDDHGTNPEELVGAALASCFSMALSSNLGKAGHTPDRIDTTARVHFEQGDAGFSIVRIELTTAASVPDIADEEFQAIAETTKATCPVSRALASVPIEITATLA
ncbi:MAG: OsmC family peroxiredoxin [Actinomycetota bacterium]